MLVTAIVSTGTLILGYASRGIISKERKKIKSAVATYLDNAKAIASKDKAAVLSEINTFIDQKL